MSARILVATPLLAMALLSACAPGGADHDDDHGHEHDHDHVEMDAQAARDAGIQTVQASLSSPAEVIDLPAEIRFDQDRVALVAPRVSGVVRALNASEGDRVEAGAVLAVLDSRELAALAGERRSAEAALALAETAFARERRLLEQGIASQAEHDAAREAEQAASARLRSADAGLRAAGADGPDSERGVNRLTAPISGTVMRRELALGQSVDVGAGPAFMIADENALWADIAVYPGQLAHVRSGARVTLLQDDGAALAVTRIGFIAPQLSETSRTAIARAPLDNADGRLRAGQFLTARVETDPVEEGLFVPARAVQDYEGGWAVFTPDDHGFDARMVVTGRRVGEHLEIVSGLQPGEAFVTEGAFTLRAELEKSGFDDGHAH